jgi:hypothetical protein
MSGALLVDKSQRADPIDEQNRSRRYHLGYQGRVPFAAHLSVGERHDTPALTIAEHDPPEHPAGISYHRSAK